MGALIVILLYGLFCFLYGLFCYGLGLLIGSGF